MKGLLTAVCTDVEQGLQPHLSNFIKGAIVRSGLPQNWLIKTESEVLTFSISTEGRARVSEGAVPNPDGVIEWNHDYLASVLRNRSSQEIPGGEAPTITTFTMKGQVGLDILKKHLGL